MNLASSQRVKHAGNLGRILHSSPGRAVRLCTGPAAMLAARAAALAVAVGMLGALPVTASDTASPAAELPLAVQRVAPLYPEGARCAGDQGVVEVRVTVGEDGRVSNAVIAWTDADQALQRAALTAACQFLFQPARQNGLAAACDVLIPFRFVLVEPGTQAPVTPPADAAAERGDA